MVATRTADVRSRRQKANEHKMTLLSLAVIGAQLQYAAPGHLVCSISGDGQQQQQQKC
jgi:hypothetical protein